MFVVKIRSTGTFLRSGAYGYLTMVKGYVNSIETFGAVDGPGVRFMVFLQGCHMRCQYCHNPETWEVAAADGACHSTTIQVMTPEEMWDQAKRYKAYWKNGGGVTVSGGEAMLQIDWLIEFFRICKQNGVHTALDTAGQPYSKDEAFYAKFEALMAVTDLVILDLKHIDPDKHKRLTGWSNESILAMAQDLARRGIHMWIRYVLVPGITTDAEDQRVLRRFIDSLDATYRHEKARGRIQGVAAADDFVVDRVEVLPYHTLGISKYENLHIKYPLQGVEPPTDEEIQQAEEHLKILRR